MRCHNRHAIGNAPRQLVDEPSPSIGMDETPTDSSHAHAALLAVLPHLDQQERCAMACVSRELRAAAMQPSLWKVGVRSG